MLPGYAEPGEVRQEGVGGEGTNTNTIRFPRKTRLALSLLKKNVRNDDHDSKGLRR